LWARHEGFGHHWELVCSGTKVHCLVMMSRRRDKLDEFLLLSSDRNPNEPAVKPKLALLLEVNDD
jgi:hypothetical protein